MVRSGWKTSLAVALSWSSLAWGQAPQLPPASANSTEQIRLVPASSTEPPRPVTPNPSERIITVQEPGRTPQQCRVLREWRMPDGNLAREVQALDSGEIMTIVDAGTVLEAPDAYPVIRQQGMVSRVFRWGRDRTPPAGTPMAPLVSQNEGTMTAGTSQPSGTVATTVKPVPQPAPVATTVKPAPQPAPVATTVKPVPQPAPVATTVKPVPQPTQTPVATSAPSTTPRWRPSTVQPTNPPTVSTTPRTTPATVTSRPTVPQPPKALAKETTATAPAVPAASTARTEVSSTPQPRGTEAPKVTVAPQLVSRPASTAGTPSAKPAVVAKPTETASAVNVASKPTEAVQPTVTAPTSTSTPTPAGSPRKQAEPVYVKGITLPTGNSKLAATEEAKPAKAVAATTVSSSKVTVVEESAKPKPAGSEPSGWSKAVETEASPRAKPATVVDSGRAKPTSTEVEPTAAAQPAWRRWFGSGETNTQFDREKYLADLRARYGHPAGGADKGGIKEVVKGPAPKLTEPTEPVAKATPAPKTTAVVTSEAAAPAKPAKTVVEAPTSTDWRQSWGKGQILPAPDKSKPSVAVAQAQPAATVTKPEAKVELPVAKPQPDPLSQPERYSQRPEVRPDAPKLASASPSPLLGGAAEAKPVPPKPAPAVEQLAAQQPAPKPAAPVVPAPAKPTTVAEAPGTAETIVQADEPGQASTVRVPMGAKSVVSAFGNQADQVAYMPVPMVTVPPMAALSRPMQAPPGPRVNAPQPMQQVPAGVQAAYHNAFTPGQAPVQQTAYNPAYANAFTNGQPMQDPTPMQGYAVPQGMAMGRPMMMPPGMMPPGMMPPGMMPPGMMPPGMMPPGQAVMPAGYYPAQVPMAPYGQPMMDPQAVHQLMQTLREALYPSQREMAAEGLASLDCRAFPQVFEALLAAAKDDPAPTVRATCIRCMTGLSVPPTVLQMTLQTLRADTDPRVRQEAENGLARLPQPGNTGSSGVQPASGVMPAGSR